MGVRVQLVTLVHVQRQCLIGDQDQQQEDREDGAHDAAP